MTPISTPNTPAATGSIPEGITAQAERSCCAVKTLPKNVLCEIDAIAAL